MRQLLLKTTNPSQSAMGKVKKEKGQDITLHFVLRETIAAGCQELFFETEESFTWTPGQWLLYDIKHPQIDERGTTRKFTISTTPSEEMIGLACRFYEDGSSFKRELLRLHPGDTVEAEGPFGEFILPSDIPGAVLVAGGIGIVPYKPMLKSWIAKGAKSFIHLIYANRSDDFPYKELLDSLSDQHTNLKIDYVNTSGAGFLDAHKIMELAGDDLYKQGLVYIAGPKPMTKDLTKQFEKSYANIRVKKDSFSNYNPDA